MVVFSDEKIFVQYGDSYIDPAGGPHRRGWVLDEDRLRRIGELACEGPVILVHPRGGERVCLRKDDAVSSKYYIFCEKLSEGVCEYNNEFGKLVDIDLPDFLAIAGRIMQHRQTLDCREGIMYVMCIQGHDALVMIAKRKRDFLRMKSV